MGSVLAVEPHVNELILTALSRKLEAEPLQPGEYELTGLVTVEVDVRIKKGSPSFRRATTSLPLKKVLAIALAKAGFMRDQIVELISTAAREALENGDKIDMDATEEALKLVEAGIVDRLPPQRVEGRTTVEGTVEIVGFDG
jgi:hypothetical protein